MHKSYLKFWYYACMSIAAVSGGFGCIVGNLSTVLISLCLAVVSADGVIKLRDIDED